MKKLLVAVLALTTLSAFAGNSMIKLDGCFDGTCDTLDFDMGGNDVSDAESKTQTIAFNYAMAFAGNYGAGITYVTKSQTTDGDIAAFTDSEGAMMNSNTIGLSFYWNKDGSWDDSCFGALHYNMTTLEDHDGTNGTDSGSKNTDIVLELGHRFKLGTLGGMTWNWAPSASYTMGTLVSNNSDADDVKSTSLSINAANIAMTF